MISTLGKITVFPTPYIIIFVVIFGVYFQTLSYGFINMDDTAIIRDSLVNVDNISSIREAFKR
jgi:hypothetical protein